jgi:hypothetical protein
VPFVGLFGERTERIADRLHRHDDLRRRRDDESVPGALKVAHERVKPSTQECATETADEEVERWHPAREPLAEDLAAAALRREGLHLEHEPVEGRTEHRQSALELLEPALSPLVDPLPHVDPTADCDPGDGATSGDNGGEDGGIHASTVRSGVDGGTDRSGAYDRGVDQLWETSRSGSHAGRGFRYQDAVAAELAVLAWRGELPVRRIVPEGLDDISLELDDHSLHLQAKSRREHRGEFKVADLRDAWGELAHRLAADPSSRAGLVLERPLAGATTGLDRALVDLADEGVRQHIADALGHGPIPVDEFLSRTHVVVMPALPVRSISLLAERLGLPPATCASHHALLRVELGRLADENGRRGASDPAAATVGDVARLLDDVTEAIDGSALEEAIRDGACELVDFATPRDDEGFYSGVDVTVGHVVAGLPSERRRETDALVAGLQTRRVALAVGPSGAGKSALIWMAAFETRHRVRWYRVRRLRVEDVTALVRLAKGLQPSPEAPVGFVVDDLGRDDRAGFDALAGELRELPGALVLGACREEDLVLVRTARAAAQVRPILDEGLAERLWQELRDAGDTDWHEWREPYESSNALLLEYGHLLTRGRRLQETIAQQVERRVVEGRADELAILPPVALANAYGAAVEVDRLVAAIELEPAAAKAALSRLADEHLVAERDGFLLGLHELRSQAITTAVHRVPPPALARTVEQAISLLQAAALHPFLTKLLLSGAVPDDVVLDAAVSRLRTEPDPAALAGVLHALRMAAFRRMTEGWRDIFESEAVPPTNVAVVAHMALHDADTEMFPAPTQRAVSRIREVRTEDLRGPLLDRLGVLASAVITDIRTIETAVLVLAALGESDRELAVDPEPLARLGDEASLPEIRMLLEAAYGASPGLAIAIAERLGGEQALLDRLEAELPWVRNTRLVSGEQGEIVASADYAYVAASHQPDAHGAVVEIAEYLRALAPSCDIAACRALDATGGVAGFRDVSLAEKTIPRRSLPGQAEVAWNRARGRAAIAAVAARTDTEHAHVARDVILQSEALVRSAGDLWVRGRRPTKQLRDDAVALSKAATEMRPPPIEIETAGPLDDGDLPLSDPASFVGDMIANNLIVRLFQPGSVAPLLPQILEKVDELAEPERWRLLADPPLEEVSQLRATLADLHAVVAEHARGDKATTVVLRHAAANGLPAAAGAARERAAGRMAAVAARVKRQLAKEGYAATIVRREGPPDSFRWPNDDFLILAESESMFRWLRDAERVAVICRPLLRDRLGFVIAPVRLGHVVASGGFKVFDDSVCPTDDVRGHEGLPLPLLDEKLADALRNGIDAAAEASGIVAVSVGRSLHVDERAALASATDRAQDAQERLAKLVDESDHDVLGEIHDVLLKILGYVDEEIEARNRDEPLEDTIAASMLSGLTDTPDDVFHEVLGASMMAIEFDVDPETAGDRFAEAVQAADAD